MFKRLGSVISENKIIKAIKDRKYSSIVSVCVSVGVLILLAALDAVMLHALYSGQYCATTILKDYAIYIVGIWLIAKIISGSPIIRFSPVILTKLLGNAIAPSNLGVAYLLVFVIHLGWLTDSTFNIISVGSQGLDIKYLVPLVCSIGGLMCIVGFFPDPYKKKNDEASTVIVSGMSVINANFWDNLKTAFEKNNIGGVKNANIMPLVRMLARHKGDMSCRLLILKSDLQTKKALLDSDKNRKKKLMEENKELYELFPFKIVVKEQKELSGELSEEQKAKIKDDNRWMDSLRKELCIASTYLVESESDEAKAERKALYEKYGVEFSINDEHEGFLVLLIRMFACFEFRQFPWMTEQIKNLEVNFTEFCNYNDYPKCFDTMKSAIREFDDDEHEIEFNITPGTALVSSVMTLLAIDGDKKLFYNKQTFGIKEDSEPMEEVDKTKLPIENLLSQALEKVSGKKS